MGYQISWEAYLTDSAVLLFFYYTAILFFPRKGILVKSYPGPSKQDTGKDVADTLEREIPVVRADSLQVGISLSLLNMLVEAVDTLVTDSKRRQYTKEKFLNVAEERFTPYLTKHATDLAPTVRIMLRYGAASCGLLLTDQAINIALGLPEAPG